ncbi:hypothetical protein [Proteus phage vB_PmiP_RS51pmB]|nr:hypothetical protein [Proteus phage vB_PmiP_RS51pmB]
MTDKLYTYGNTPYKTLPPIYSKDGSHNIASLRDMFAAKAMQGILSNPGQLDNVNKESAEWVSRDAYLVADAMLKARGE